MNGVRSKGRAPLQLCESALQIPMQADVAAVVFEAREPPAHVLQIRQRNVVFDDRVEPGAQDDSAIGTLPTPAAERTDCGSKAQA